MKTLIGVLIFIVTLVSCKKSGDLSTGDIRRTIQMTKIKARIDSMEFANQMWVLENKRK